MRTKLKPCDFYDEDSMNRIYLEGMLRDGYSIEDICNNIGIDHATFYRWTDKDEKFATIVRNAREICNFEIESALKRQCKGFYVDTEVIDKQGNKQTIKTYIPPSVEAQKFWLKNKKPDGWKEKVDQMVDTTAIDTLKDILGSLKGDAASDSEEEHTDAEEENKLQP